MSRKKIIVYTIIFIISVACSAWFKYEITKNPTANFNEACKMTHNTTCQQYITQITKEKKYQEALDIQKVKISENIQILKYYKSKISDKCLLQMTAKEAEDTLISCLDKPKRKEDYLLLKTADFTVKEIFADSIAVSQLQHNEFDDTKSAIKTLKIARKIVKNNIYIEKHNEIIEYIDSAIAELTKRL